MTGQMLCHGNATLRFDVKNLSSSSNWSIKSIEGLPSQHWQFKISADNHQNQILTVQLYFNWTQGNTGEQRGVKLEQADETEGSVSQLCCSALKLLAPVLAIVLAERAKPLLNQMLEQPPLLHSKVTYRAVRSQSRRHSMLLLDFITPSDSLGSLF